MSTQHNDGGPAFPIPPVGTCDPRDGMSAGYSGMSLRDWFAGQILASGVIDTEDCGSVGDAMKELGITNYDHRMHWPMLRAKRAYEAADAMLAERNKEKP